MKPNDSTATLVERINGARVVVVGDVMLDRFVEGKVDRISPEAPIPVFVIQRETMMLGAAGNVLRNLVALGANASLISAVGDDAAGEEVRALLVNERVSIGGLHMVSGRRTSIKTRYIASGQQMLRTDSEIIEDIPIEIQDAILGQLALEVLEAGAVLLSDYGKGVLPEGFVRRLIKIACDAGCPVVVDPIGNNYSRYAGAQLVTPNRQELARATNLPTESDEEVIEASQNLIKTTKVGAVLVTRSERGMTIYDGAVTSHLRARARGVFDVSGAGDTVAATIAAAIAAQSELLAAAMLANLAAGIVVGKVGTGIVHPAEIMAAAREGEWSDAGEKLLNNTLAIERVSGWRRRGKRIGFTNGCFDLLHPGHISLIVQARRHCDQLVIGLNSDASVKRLKGENRPVQDERNRATVLASLSDVDMVVVFTEDTPIKLIRSLKPDVLVKGADYSVEEVVGADEVKAWGGTVVLAELLAGHSTTETVRRLKN